MSYPPLCDPIPGVAPDAFGAAAEQIRNFCNWHVAPVVTETVTFDGTGSALLMLKSLRVTAVGEVLVNGSAVTDYTWSKGGYLWRSAGWGGCNYPDGYLLGSITVTFTHGYETCPAELRAVLQLMSTQGMQTAPVSVQVGNVRVQQSPAQTAGVLGTDAFVSTLNRYRVV